ncbi:MAG: hypothetical protein GXO39_04305 [Thermotogae bacterium]|nr:hypothetical protein [Thermotogota bacterium]
MITMLLAGGLGYWHFGYGVTDLTEVRRRLEKAGYPSPHGGGYLSGGEGYAFIGDFLLGGGSFETSLAAATSPNYLSEGKLSVGYFSLGYALLKSAKVLLFPSLGVGGGSLTLRISESKTGNFDDVLKDPPTRIVLNAEGFFIKGGLTFLYRYTFLAIGINAGAGYLFASGWKINENLTTGYPESRSLAFWGKLVIGGGWW